ncbi:MAG: hypothetical protein J5821_04905 [Alphaproteobacteria bacterium]|nr:hypothetical protein [Alphaproteobacteria bacterium]
MNKSLLIASLALISATVLGMRPGVNNQKMYLRSLHTHWEVTDSRQGIENSNQEVMDLVQNVIRKNADLENRLEESENRNTELREENQQKDEELQRERELKNKVANNLFFEEVSQAKPNSEKRKLQEERDKYKKKYKIQKKVSEKLNKKLKESPNPEVQELSKFVKELQEKITRYKLSINELKEKNNELKKQNEFLESNKGKENTETKELKEEIEDLKSQLKERDIEYKEIVKELAQTEKERDQAWDIIRNLQSSFLKLDPKVKTLFMNGDLFLKLGSKSQNDDYEWQAVPTYYQVKEFE